MPNKRFNPTCAAIRVWGRIIMNTRGTRGLTWAFGRGTIIVSRSVGGLLLAVGEIQRDATRSSISLAVDTLRPLFLLRRHYHSWRYCHVRRNDIWVPKIRVVSD